MPLLDLRKQIASTVSTRAITKAMQLVAANKMKGFVKEAKAARVYLNELERSYAEVAPLLQEMSAAKPEHKQTLFLLFTSDKGLCGALNTRVIKTLLQSEAWKNTPPDERVIIAFGRKGHEAAKRLKLNVDKTILRAPESLDSRLAWKLFGDTLDKILNGQTQEVYAVHPVYETAFSFNTRVSHFTQEPQATPTEQPRKSSVERAIIEPSVDEYVKTVKTRMVVAKIIASVAELKATEYSSRMVAMQKATDAATEKIASLTMAYHKARQALITQEIAELSAAGEAMTSAYAHEISLINA